MIRTNSRQARQNVQAYIMEHFDGCNYEIETPATIPGNRRRYPLHFPQ